MVTREHHRWSHPSLQRSVVWAMVLAAGLSGCTMIEQAIEKKPQGSSERVKQVQTDVMRFADEYVGRVLPIEATYRSLEAQAWDLAATLLTTSQVAELRTIIDRWRAAHPTISVVAYIHFGDFARSIGEPTPDKIQAPGNLFATLGIDPLTSLDPAVQEITQARLLAERAIYYMQRTPGPIGSAKR